MRYVAKSSKINNNLNTKIMTERRYIMLRIICELPQNNIYQKDVINE